MSPRRSFALVACVCLLAVTAAGCSGAGSEEQQKKAQQQEDWAWLQQTKQQLDAKRQELAALRQQLHDAPVEEAAVAEGQAAPAGSRADLESRIANLEAEISAQSEELGGRVVGYINSFETSEGDPMPAEQQQAIRMKSDEDIEVALEWIEKGGDYRRAIEIYETQRMVDPGYDRLEQALASAQQMRYMTEERFAQVKKGMTQSEVRAALGPVNLHNVQQYPDKKIEAWFYPREGGGASGVYFRLDDSRNAYLVYQTTFEVKGKESAPAQPGA